MYVKGQPNVFSKCRADAESQIDRLEFASKHVVASLLHTLFCRNCNRDPKIHDAVKLVVDHCFETMHEAGPEGEEYVTLDWNNVKFIKAVELLQKSKS